MNPETGTFHPDTPDLQAEHPDWPRFAVEEELEIKGYTFKILRINRTNLVVQPVPVRGCRSPKELIAKMT